MIRLTLLWLFVGAVSVYAWKDWYRALCGLILLMAVIEHPDMPKSLFSVQGLNPWNVACLSVLLAWAASRRREGLRWDMPRHVTVLLFLYLAVIVIGFSRMMADPTNIEHFSTGDLVAEQLINSIKWVVPGLLLFDGCRTRPRFILALTAVLGLYLLLALQVIRWMPAEAALSGDTLRGRSAKILLNEVGYHRVNLSMMLAGASWAILAAQALARHWARRLLIVGAALAVMYAQALTGGRMGYVTFAAVGLTLCFFRWRRYLLVTPLVVMLLISILPGVGERMLEGFGDNEVDEYAVTAGRNIAWPYVIAKLDEAPIIGFGRLAMVRTGLEAFLLAEHGEEFAHPHNAYLEMLLDNGWVGLLLVLPLYLVILARSLLLFVRSSVPLYVTAGGVASALVLALLVAGYGSQTFYPREGAVGMWCAIGLVLRVSVERARVRVNEPDPLDMSVRSAPWWRRTAASA
jgi:O-antigen ligase